MSHIRKRPASSSSPVGERVMERIDGGGNVRNSSVETQDALCNLLYIESISDYSVSSKPQALTRLQYSITMDGYRIAVGAINVLVSSRLSTFCWVLGLLLGAGSVLQSVHRSGVISSSDMVQTVCNLYARLAAEMDGTAMGQTERPDAPLRTETFRKGRPMIVGEDTPESPFPITLSGAVQHGFKRGGRELGCHTANLPDNALEPMASVVKTGIYYGYAQVHPECPEGSASQLPHEDLKVWPMVMSLGWNPYYKNEKLTAEIHIIHRYADDFYGHNMTALVLGYIRPELDYTSKEDLIEDIQTDIKVALNSLQRPAYAAFSQREAFRQSTNSYVGNQDGLE